MDVKIIFTKLISYKTEEYCMNETSAKEWLTKACISIDKTV